MKKQTHWWIIVSIDGSWVYGRMVFYSRKDAREYSKAIKWKENNFSAPRVVKVGVVQ